MPRFSLMSHCRVCGKEITQAGSARKWVHVNEFYSHADHEPQPRENNKFMLPKRDPEPAAPAPPLSEAERRRRMREGLDDPADTKAKRRRTAEPVTPAHDIDIDAAARRLRRLRLGLDPDGED